MNIVNPVKNENIIFYGKKNKKNKLIYTTNTNMQTSFNAEQLKLMNIIKKTAGDKDVFLFGGSVRDCLMNKPINDLDFIINGNPIDFSKKLVEQNHDVFKSVFIKPEVNRSVVYTKNIDIDFKPLCNNCQTVKGKDNLRKALIKNLFSINSMAIKLDTDIFGGLKLKFVDYLKVKKDLAKNELKYNSKETFLSDPIRALRGIRIKLKYGMKIDSDTKKLIKESITNPKIKKNKFYFRYIRECFKITKEIFKKIL